MSKKTVDLTIEKSMTLLVKNYSTIKPKILVTLHNVDVDKVDKEYENLSDFTSALLAKEIIVLSNEMNAFDQLGFNKYVQGLREAENQIDKVIKNFKEG